MAKMIMVFSESTEEKRKRKPIKYSQWDRD